MRGSTPSDIVLFALVVTFVPALVLLASSSSSGSSTRASRRLSPSRSSPALVAVFAVQAFERLGSRSTVPLIAGSALAGVAVAVAVWRVSAARTFLTVLGPRRSSSSCSSSSTRTSRSSSSPGRRVQSARRRRVDAGRLRPLRRVPVIALMKANGEIDAKRFPNFARLARASTWFRNTTSLSASTTVAVPAILSGKPAAPQAAGLAAPRQPVHPPRRRLPDARQESQTRLCPRSSAGTSADRRRSGSRPCPDARVVYLHLVSPPALEDRLPAIDESWGNFGDETAEAEGPAVSQELAARPCPRSTSAPSTSDASATWKSFVSGIRPDPAAGRRCYFLHTSSPRALALLPRRPGERRDEPARAGPRRRALVGQRARARGVAAAPPAARLHRPPRRRLIIRLRRARLWDRAVIVVTADHGISFRGGDKRRAPTRTNLAELAFVPFFIKRPGEPAAVVDKHVRTVDLLPTIADALDVEIPWRTDGESGFAPGEGSDTVKVGFGPLSKSFDAALEQRRASLRRQLDLFGSGSWGNGFFGVGPYESLLGRRVSALFDLVRGRRGENRPGREPVPPRPPPALAARPLAACRNAERRGAGRRSRRGGERTDPGGGDRLPGGRRAGPLHRARTGVRVPCGPELRPRLRRVRLGRPAEPARAQDLALVAGASPRAISPSRGALPGARSAGRGCCRPRAASRPGGRDRR